MNYINGFNEVTPFDGSSERLTPGGHICKVMEVRPDKDSKGNDRILIALEVAEGSKFDGIYTTDENESGNNRYDNTDDPCGNPQRSGEGRTDGV